MEKKNIKRSGKRKKEIIKIEVEKKVNKLEKRIGLVFILILTGIVTFIIYTQARTVESTDYGKIKIMKDTELREELSSIRNKAEEYKKNIQRLEEKLEEYKNKSNDQGSILEAQEILKEELDNTKLILGYTNVEGEGVIVKLSDNANSRITSSDLLILVNQLNIAGAEAISINDRRMVSISDLSTVEGSKIMTNGNILQSPYIVKAIGNKKDLNSALTIKDGYINQMFANSKTIEIKSSSNIRIPKYEGEINVKYSR